MFVGSSGHSEVVILFVINFSQGLNTLDHYQLLEKLKLCFGSGHYAVKLIKSYFENRYLVRINNPLATHREISSLVPQASTLRPMLLRIFINDYTTSSKIHVYANDVQIYLLLPLSLVEGMVEKTDDFRTIMHWSDEKNLRLNSTKIKAITILHGKVDVMANTDAEFVSVVFNVGFTTLKTL